MPPALIILLAYLIGSIPFGYLIVKLRGEGDIRETGSGGTGATNVTRRAGRAAGVLTLALDAAKGAVAVLLARWLLTTDFGVNWWVAGAAIAAIAGHVFPVWLGFRGGKGVATGGGVLLAASWWMGLAAALAWLAVAAITRRSSAGALAACVAVPLVALAVGRTDLALFAAGVAVLVVARHRDNIARLMAGTEPRIGGKA